MVANNGPVDLRSSPVGAATAGGASSSSRGGGRDALWLSRESFRSFADLVVRETGIKMSDAKLSMLQSRLQHRMRVLGLSSLESYRSYLFGPPVAEAEMTHFIDAVTTNKTDFFREPQHFHFLEQRVLRKEDPGEGKPWRFKVWCAGCSSGEEAYTLAMVLSAFGRQRAGFDFDIFATDISTRVLKAARDAVYDEERIQPLPEDLRRGALLRSKDRRQRLVRIAPAVRERVRFARLNFMSPDFGMREIFDVIFFRNVMIYFDKETQEKVIARLCRHLRPNGLLFLGHSESLVGLDLPLKMVGAAIYQLR